MSVAESVDPLVSAATGASAAPVAESASGGEISRDSECLPFSGPS